MTTNVDVPVVRTLLVPEDPEAERIVLGTVATLGAVERGEVFERLEPDDFYHLRHAHLFAALRSVHHTGGPFLAYEIRSGGKAIPIDAAMGRSDATVVATVPRLTGALRASGARCPERCVLLMEELMETERVAFVRSYVDRVIDASVARQMMNVFAEAYGALGRRERPVDVFADQRVRVDALVGRLKVGLAP